MDRNKIKAQQIMALDSVLLAFKDMKVVRTDLVSGRGLVWTLDQASSFVIGIHNNVARPRDTVTLKSV